MRFFLTLWLWLLAVMLPPVAHAAYWAESDYSRASLISEQSTIAAGKPFRVALHLQMKDDWHSYWRNAGDVGLPVSIRWKLPEGFTTGEISWPAPKRYLTENIVNFVLPQDAYLPLTITPPAQLSAGEIPLKAEVNWISCKDVCVPESASLSLLLPVGAEPVASEKAAEITDALNRLPKPMGTANYSVSGTSITLQFLQEGVVLPSPIRKADFFPVMEGIVNNNAAATLAFAPDMILLTTEKRETAEAVAKKTPEIILALTYEAVGEEKTAYYSYMLAPTPSAAIAGTAAASTAAVTTTTPHNTTETSQLSWLPALLYALLGGLILNIMPCVLPVLSLKIFALAKKAASDPKTVRRQGLAYTAGVLLCFLSLAGGLILLQQAGTKVGWGFQMQSPLFVGALCYLIFVMGLNLAGLFQLPVLAGGVQTGSNNSFLTGLLAALIATPCTAPFMAPAIGYALTQPPVVGLSVFFALGMGMALPFLLISFFPALRTWIPRPGLWMEHFKHFLAFPMFATALWLLWILTQQVESLSLAIYLCGFITLSLGIWLWQFIRERGSFIRILFIAVVLALSLLPLKLLTPVVTIAEERETVAYSATALEKLRAEGKSVFVDATAAWCITCKVNENLVLNTKAVRALFKENNIVYMVADWTQRNDAIKDYLSSFGREGVPLYVYYPSGKDPIVLPQVLTESIVKEAIAP